MNKKNYISELVTMNEYATWLSGKKVMLVAPTGLGKTRFVLSKFLPFCISQRRKVAILCNRRLLREQYLYDLAETYTRYYIMNEQVQLFTYQTLAECIKQGKKLEKVLDDYDVIVCDESHFFYADSDFNVYGTFVLLQTLIRICIHKCMLFITATADEVIPLLDRTLEQCGKTYGISEEFCSMKVIDYSYLSDYSRFRCFFVEDVQSLCRRIGESPMKSIIFIDDKTKAESLRRNLMDMSEIKGKDIFILNAEVLDECSNNEVIQQLVVCHRILPKVLITTSVLDNGVSVHDADVENVVIATDSMLSFIQMLGRIRSESSVQCNLYLYPRDEKYYARRIEQTKGKMQKIAMLEQSIQLRKSDLVMQLWDEVDTFYRNMAVLVEEAEIYYSCDVMPVRILCGDFVLAVNEFAKEKIGNMALAYRRFFKAAMHHQVEVAKAQIAWIGKTPDELVVLQSTYREERIQELKRRLLAIQNVSNEELQEIKSKLARDFREDLIGDIVTKNQSFSKGKFVEICECYDLKLIENKDLNGKKRYTVIEKEDI